ncbi:acetolactate synthase small subunit [Halobacteria archaeon AArc-dxtr1]|nr:acetolactate synthase small subunit [Halobacteria archaeon AArc-dxtr1]
MTGGLDGPAPEERPVPQGRRTPQGVRIDPEVEAQYESRRTVISVLVEHEPGVLAEVSGLFSRRQFNIESLTVGPTEDESRARITLVVEETDPGIDQIKRQLRKLVPVETVRELESDAMRRELALIKVNATRPDRVAAIADMYGGKSVDASPETATIELTGSRQKIDAAIESFGQFGIREISRTGVTALARGTSDTARETTPEESTQTQETNAAMQTHADDD